MTESERRRIKLLKDTRARYRDGYEVPAVHPRYQNVYRSLYNTSEEEMAEDTFHTLGFRTLLCVIAFIIFAVMDREGESVLHVDSHRIYEEITRDTDVEDAFAEVWKIIKER